MQHGSITVNNTAIRTIEPKQIICSTLQIQDSASNLSHTCDHYWWQGWPDHGVPTNYMASFRLLKCFANKTPIVIHCSAGVGAFLFLSQFKILRQFLGRTGTLVCLDIAQQHVNANRPFKFMEIVRDLRKQRDKSVQTLSQYLYVDFFERERAQNAKIDFCLFPLFSGICIEQCSIMRAKNWLVSRRRARFFARIIRFDERRRFLVA